MYCLSCNAEIEAHGQKQCPKCNSLLLENCDQKILTNDLQTDKQARYTQTDAREDRSESVEPDAFNSLLEDITSDIDRLVVSDKQDAAESAGQVPKDDKASTEAPDKKVELTAEIDQETSDIDQPVDDLEPLIQGLDELIEEDLDSKLEAGKEDQPIDDLEPLLLGLDELIEEDLDSKLEAGKEDQPIDDLEPLILELDELIEKEPDNKIETGKEDELLPAEPDTVIELTDVVELTDMIELVSPEKDELPTKGSDEIIDLLEIIEPVVDHDDEFIETIPAVEIQSVENIDPEDCKGHELIEEITEQDVVYIEPQATDVESPAKSKRSSKAVFAAAGVTVLLIATVLGGKLYFKSKPSTIVTLQKTSAVLVKNKAKPPVAPKKTGLERDPGAAGKNPGKQHVDTAKTDPVVNNKQAAVVFSKVNDDQKPLLSINGIEQQTIDTLKSAPVPSTQNKALQLQAKIIPTAADEKKVLKSDTPAAYIPPGEPYFTIQVASSKSRTAAQSSLARLRNKGYAAYISEKMTSKGLVRYKLRIGKYKTKAQAKKAAGAYFDTEQKPFIIVQSKE